MLILSRRSGESIVIAKNIKVHILQVRGNQARVGIEAPRNIDIYRAEIMEGITTKTNGNAQYLYKKLAPTEEK